MPVEKILWVSQLMVCHFRLETYPTCVTAMLPDLSRSNLPCRLPTDGLRSGFRAKILGLTPPS
jgi:hypothetical protein